MMNLGPNWYPPTTGMPDFPMTLPAEVAVALGSFWLATLVISLAGIVWTGMQESRHQPLGKSDREAPRRQPRGRARLPALYPV
jgi:hypothetical protein